MGLVWEREFSNLIPSGAVFILVVFYMVWGGAPLNDTHLSRARQRSGKLSH